MPEILRWQGTVGSEGIARDLWSDADDDQFVSVVIQSGKPVGDDELNLIGQIAEAGLRRLTRGLVSDGLLSGGTLVFGDQLPTPPPNTFYVQAGIWLVDHFPFLVADSRNVGDSLSLSQALAVVLDAPPTGSTPRTDLAMLEFWFEEVASPGQNNASTTVYERGGVGNLAAPNGNDIQNTIILTETSRRVQARWRIRAVDGTSTVAGVTAWGAVNNNASGLTYALMPGSTVIYRAGSLGTDAVRDKGTLTDANTLQTVSGFSYAVQIATLTRLPNVTTVAPGDVISGPPQAQVLAQVPRSQIVPALPDPLPGEDNYPIAFTYNGSLGDTTDGTGLTAYSLLSQHLATNFSVVRSSALANSGTLTRVELHLSGSGAGSDLIVEIVTDSTGPTGPVLATFIVPKEWLTGSPRWISIPVGASIVWGGSYWVRIRQAGSGSNFVNWIGEPSTSADRTRSLASTGSLTASWAVSNNYITVEPDLHIHVFVDTPANTANPLTQGTVPQTLFDQVMNTIEGAAPAVTVEEYEYDSVLGVIYVGDATYDAGGNLTDANLAQFTHDSTTGTITGITRVNARS